MRLLSNSKFLRRRNNFSNKRAVSEVIATVVLIMASVVLGGVAYVWASSSSVASQNNLGLAAQHDVNAVSERFEIIATNFTYSGANYWKSVQIYVYNNGIIKTNVSLVFDNTTSIPFTTNTSGNQLPAGQLIIVTATPSSLQPKSLVTLKIVGSYGFYATYQVQP